MPVAIVISRGDIIPAILYEESVVALVARLQSLAEAPALRSEQEARIWLQSLPEPSGWYDTPEEAKAHVVRLKQDAPILPGATVEKARKALGLSRFKFGEALGMGGNQNTINKSIAEIEGEALHKTTGKTRVLNPIATRRLFALLAEEGLSEILN